MRSYSHARRSLAAVPVYFGFAQGGNRQRSTSWGVLRDNRRFRAYFIGCVTSDFGTWMQNTAQLLLTYRLSHSVLVVGLVTCAQFSSPLLLGPWAGVVADRFGSRRTLFATQVTAALLSGMLAVAVFADRASGWVLGIGALVSGLAFTFALPARNVTLRRLVRPTAAESAFALDSVSYNLGRTVAPPLTALLLTATGFGWAFAANALSFLIFAWALALAGPGHGTEAGKRSRLTEGFAVARDWQIAVPLLMVAAVTVADDPVTVLGPALARHLGASASLPAWFLAALGAGTVLGSLRPSRHKPSLGKAASALAFLGVCMIVFTQSRWTWLSVVAAFGAGIGCLVANSTTKTLLTERAGPARQAPVMAVWAIAWAGSKPGASLADGLMAEHFGLKWAGFALALPALVPALVMAAVMAAVFAARARHPRETRALACNGNRPESPNWFQRAELYLPWISSPSDGGTTGIASPGVAWADDNNARLVNN